VVPQAAVQAQSLLLRAFSQDNLAGPGKVDSPESSFRPGLKKYELEK
jgi:hypothetical protein